MVVRHAITVSGPRHDVEMNLGVRIGYDEQGKFATIDVEPADIDLRLRRELVPHRSVAATGSARHVPDAMTRSSSCVSPIRTSES
jgi:hypothetical protein